MASSCLLFAPEEENCRNRQDFFRFAPSIVWVRLWALYVKKQFLLDVIQINLKRREESSIRVPRFAWVGQFFVKQLSHVNSSSEMLGH
jgi:hypothetical protein